MTTTVSAEREMRARDVLSFSELAEVFTGEADGLGAGKVMGVAAEEACDFAAQV